METDTPTPAAALLEAAGTSIVVPAAVPAESTDTNVDMTDVSPQSLPSPTIHRPWLPAELTAHAGGPPKQPRKREFRWPEGAMKIYNSLPRGQARKTFLKAHKERQGIKTKPKPKPRVPRNFAWPKGLRQEELLAKKPGKERMEFLARFIKHNHVELEETALPSRPVKPPLGRQPEPLMHPRCGCSSSEACASCSRCVELHCKCGLAGRRRRALCHESRACSCPLPDPTMRCSLCHGCRQPAALFSHCRCVLHQKFLWIKRHPELNVELTEKEEKEVCKCFVLAHRHGGAAATKKKEANALKETERVRRIKRAAGFPSSDNIYRSNKIDAFLGDGGLECDFDDGVDDGLGSEVLSPRTESVIPRTMASSMVDHEYNPASYHPLFRSEGSSLVESIEPRNGRINQMETTAYASESMQHEICRGLENYEFELDRNAAMPSDDLVDFVVYMASVKAVNVGELIGTFEDSAAIAGSIVIEEYMKQLLEDAVTQQKGLCSPTKANVQAFTRECLVGFNWTLFLQQLQPDLPQDTLDEVEMLTDAVAALIFHEFVSTQPQNFDETACREDLTEWIRSAVEIPHSVLAAKQANPDVASSQDQTMDISSTERTSGNQASRKTQQDNSAAQSSTQIRLSVKANALHGNPEYKLHLTATLEDGHNVETSVGGVDSRFRANAHLSQLSKVVERQELRSKGVMVDPPTPGSGPTGPGPEPVPRPPPIDPEDPFASMFALVWEHFNDYAHQKWEASRDEYLRATTQDQEGVHSKREAAEEHQSTGPAQKKAKVTSQ